MAANKVNLGAFLTPLTPELSHELALMLAEGAKKMQEARLKRVRDAMQTLRAAEGAVINT